MMTSRHESTDIDRAVHPAGMSLPPRIIGRPGEDDTYMIRWTLARLMGFELKLHVFLRSDSACLHDHPWSFISVGLAGSYREITEAGTKTYRAPWIIFRRGTHRHRVEIDAPCLTLNISAPRTRRWGFWTPSGFVHWKRYNESDNEC